MLKNYTRQRSNQIQSDLFETLKKKDKNLDLAKDRDWKYVGLETMFQFNAKMLHKIEKLRIPHSILQIKEAKKLEERKNKLNQIRERKEERKMRLKELKQQIRDDKKEEIEFEEKVEISELKQSLHLIGL